MNVTPTQYYERKPFRFSSFYSLYLLNTDSNKASEIVCGINPERMSIKWVPRGTVERTASGLFPVDTKLYRENALYKGFFDEHGGEERKLFDPETNGSITVDFSFQSGSVLPVHKDNKDGTSYFEMPHGVDALNTFLQLVSEPMTYWDAEAKQHRLNLFTCETVSLLFPTLSFVGFWNPDGLGAITSSSDSDNVVRWNASFVALTTYPKIHDAKERKEVYEEALAERFDPSHYNELVSVLENVGIPGQYATTILGSAVSGNVSSATNESRQRVANFLQDNI